jgi:hypothetical protein
MGVSSVPAVIIENKPLLNKAGFKSTQLKSDGLTFIFKERSLRRSIASVLSSDARAISARSLEDVLRFVKSETSRAFVVSDAQTMRAR